MTDERDPEDTGGTEPGPESSEHGEETLRTEEEDEGADAERSGVDESPEARASDAGAPAPDLEVVAPAEPPAAEPEDSDAHDSEVEERLRRLSRRGFISMTIAAGAGYAGWKWIETRPRIDRRPWPYRRVLQGNERLARAFYDRDRLSPTFPPDRIEPLRPNGRIGLQQGQSDEDWSVTLHGVAGVEGPVEVPLSEIMRLPGDEMITELRCIEGWTRINRWSGTRLIELMKRYPPATRDGSPPDLLRRPERLVRYVSIETPGREYYVGLDMASAIHPQTMLVWAMNGEPINWLHGAPLRLGIPVKYGIKNIKRIAAIRFTDRRPDDYWAERGYDWYAGF